MSTDTHPGSLNMVLQVPKRCQLLPTAILMKGVCYSNMELCHVLIREEALHRIATVTLRSKSLTEDGATHPYEI